MTMSISERVTFDEFLKLDIRVGTIVEALPFPEAQPYKPSPLYGGLMSANRFIQDQFKANPQFKEVTQKVLTTIGKRE